MLRNREGDDPGLVIRRKPRKPDENDPRRDAPLAEDEFPEIFVRRQKRRAPLVGEGKHRVIGYAGGHVGDIMHIMSGFPEEIHDLSIHTLVGEEVHALLSSTG